MGELAALWPHRTGGTPSYAYEAFRPLGESTARHIGGVSGWSYWLGWFPVAPINMILAASYIAVLFHVPLGRMVDPLGGLGTPEGIGVLIITLVGLVVLFIPCYLGVRLGTGFATAPRDRLHGAAHPAGHPAGVQAQHLPLVQRLAASTSPIRRRPASSSS